MTRKPTVPTPCPGARPVPGSFLGRPFRRLGRDPQAVRAAVQVGFLALCLWTGVQFARFVHWGASAGRAGYVPHPAGAEAFLPISALLSLKHWALTGQVHPFHPAGLFFLLAALGTGLLLKKAFCSWICPVGTLGEWLWLLGRRLSGRTLTPPRWADYPLRSLKYLLLGLFLWAVWRMDGPVLAAFLDSPYNAVADVRMYGFFAHLSGLALGVILALAGLSLVVPNAWCRYLCPYGALLGLLSLASPVRVTRSPATCIDCRKCTRACPARIQVHQAGRVGSDECTACYRCVAVCPVKDTLHVRVSGGRALPGWVFALMVTGLFLAVTGMAILSGHWRTALTPQDYLELIPAAQNRVHP